LSFHKLIANLTVSIGAFSSSNTSKEIIAMICRIIFIWRTYR